MSLGTASPPGPSRLDLVLRKAAVFHREVAAHAITKIPGMGVPTATARRLPAWEWSEGALT
jgi:hypothetical protein